LFRCNQQSVVTNYNFVVSIVYVFTMRIEGFGGKKEEAVHLFKFECAAADGSVHMFSRRLCCDDRPDDVQSSQSLAGPQGIESIPGRGGGDSAQPVTVDCEDSQRISRGYTKKNREKYYPSAVPIIAHAYNSEEYKQCCTGNLYLLITFICIYSTILEQVNTRLLC